LNNKILIVDDEMAVRYSFERAFGAEYCVITAENGLEALKKVTTERPDVVLMDIRMPVMDGMEAFLKIKEVSPFLPVIIMTAHGDTGTAIEAMKQGAFDYITKPFENREIRALIEKGIAISRQHAEEGCLCTDGDGSFDSNDRIVGKSNAILTVCKLIGQVSKSDVPILITGESGVGKELVSKAIHNHSPRKGRPFVAVNCAALPENLVESELFGYEHGAFTGADKRRIGKFEQCSGGTIFLDEIGDMNLMTQAKVLRVLQDATFERLGGNQTIKVDVRVIAATNKNLLEEVRAGRFRSDLFHRLNVVSINIPPLRERCEDIPVLVEYFIKRANKEMDRNIMGITPEALKTLRGYYWPGNVRELENTIRRAILIAKGNILTEDDLVFVKQTTLKGERAICSVVEDMVDCMLMSGEERIYDKIISEVERALISRVLILTQGNQEKASVLSGITRVTLRKKIEDYGITTFH